MCIRDRIATTLLSTFLEKLKHIHTYRDSKPTTSILTITSNVVYGKADVYKRQKTDIANMKTDITNMKTDITNMKADITNMKTCLLYTSHERSEISFHQDPVLPDQEGYMRKQKRNVYVWSYRGR